MNHSTVDDLVDSAVLPIVPMDEIRLGLLAEIPPGEGREFQLGEERVAVFHARSGAVYAVQAHCPHRAGPLADGLLGGSIIVCPFHSRKFDLADGRSLMDDCDLKTYPVRLDERGRIFLSR